jgi:hypothetical protein
MITTQESKRIAAQTLIQLGGRRFLAMTGCTNLICDKYTMTMKLRRNKSGAQWIKITLNAMDLYDVEFIKMNRNYELITVSEHKGLYSDDLAPTFEEVTGMYTSL